MTKDDIEHELEDLQALVDSDGWRRFVARASNEYIGDGFRNAIAKVISDPVKVQGTLYASQEIERILQWPQERIRQLKAHGKRVSATIQ